MELTIKEQLIEAAKRAGAHYGIPWQVLAAMSGQESGFGRACAAQHNYMGIKWSKTSLEMAGPLVPTKEFSNTRAEVTIKAVFCAYQSPLHCMLHAGRKLRNQVEYRDVAAAADLIIDPLNPTIEELQRVVRAVGKVWATDAIYAEQVMGIVRREGWSGAREKSEV